MKKRVMGLFLLLIFAVQMTATSSFVTLMAAEKPAKPSIVLSKESENAIKVTIKATSGAQGYRIYLKTDANKYKKVATLKKDGKTDRSYVIQDLLNGTYSIKVKAYSKDNGKTIWSKYSKVKTVILSSKETAFEKESILAYVEKNYPYMKAAVEKGVVGVTADLKKDTIVMGHFDFEDENGSSDGKKEAIEWEVLDYSADGKKALVISKYIIKTESFNPYNTTFFWENWSLRKWLNEDFYNGAFSEEERKLIKLTTNENGNTGYAFDNHENNTKDYIFLLSADEVLKYFPVQKDGDKLWESATLSSHSTIAEEPTIRRLGLQKTATNDLYPRSWWTRTFSSTGVGPTGYGTNFVQFYDGGVHDRGVEDINQLVFRSPERYYYALSGGVRPALWIELTPEIIKENNLSIKKADKEEINKLYFTFGEYNMFIDTIFDEDKGHYKERRETSKIEWQILDYDFVNNRVLLLSRYCLEDDYFHNEECEDIGWENSYIRNKLNNSFYQDSFSKDERQFISKARIENEANHYSEDRLFLLSLAEVEKYFNGRDEEYCYDLECSYFGGMRCSSWWLRTTGTGNIGDWRHWIADAGDGYLSTRGTPVESAMSYGKFLKNGIRPAFWLDLKKMGE